VETESRCGFPRPTGPYDNSARRPGMRPGGDPAGPARGPPRPPVGPLVNLLTPLDACWGGRPRCRCRVPAPPVLCGPEKTPAPNPPERPRGGPQSLTTAPPARFPPPGPAARQGGGASVFRLLWKTKHPLATPGFARRKPLEKLPAASVVPGVLLAEPRPVPPPPPPRPGPFSYVPPRLPVVKTGDPRPWPPARMRFLGGPTAGPPPRRIPGGPALQIPLLPCCAGPPEKTRLEPLRGIAPSVPPPLADPTVPPPSVRGRASGLPTPAVLPASPPTPSFFPPRPSPPVGSPLRNRFPPARGPSWPNCCPFGDSRVTSLAANAGRRFGVGPPPPPASVKQHPWPADP